jgi:hypothetical protein
LILFFGHLEKINFDPKEQTMNMSHAQLRERYSFSDYLYYTILMAVPFFTAFYAIFNRSTAWLILYVLLCLSAIAIVYRYYCTHCPHYTREGKTTKCMFFWGIPKFFQGRPGPLGFLDKTLSIAAAVVVIVFPLYWLFQQPGLLVIFILSLTIFMVTIRRNECGRCIYFDCPANKAPKDLKTTEDD